MPNPIAWTIRHDARLRAILNAPGGSLKLASAQMGVSRSYLQRRAVALRQATSACTKERELAGTAPLPAGHQITRGAIEWLTETRALVAMPGYVAPRQARDAEDV